MDYEPPFLETYKRLLEENADDVDVSEKCESGEIPVVDLGRLSLDESEREECMREMTEAARTWGFFQVVNHGVSQETLQSLRCELIQVFRLSFANKSQHNFLNLPATTYRWGNPSATNFNQISWSEAFHMFLPDISMIQQHQTFRSTIEAFASVVAPLAERLVQILAQKLNIKFSYFQENCSAHSSFLRLNRYPQCPFPSKVFGLLPHTDSSFLTIVHQDHIGGLQLMKDGYWVGIKPNPQALVVNIGDLFQSSNIGFPSLNGSLSADHNTMGLTKSNHITTEKALSNDSYISVKHRVVAAEKEERFSMAYFYNPSKDAMIESPMTPPMYRKFTFQEYRKQTEKDVKETGDKVGLSRFLFVETYQEKF